MVTPQKKWKLKNPEKVKEEARKYYEKHKDKILKYRHSYYKRKKEQELTSSGQYYRKHREEKCKELKERYAQDPEYRKRKLEDGRRNKRKLRLEIISLLGSKCSKCGFSDERALQIDHLKGGGNLDRHANPSSWTYYKHILEEIKTGSKDYQLLCANHNCIKRITNQELGNKFVG